MHTQFAERHIRSLSIAKTCAELGARIRTITYITGLEHGELVRLFFVDKQSAPRGRPPDSPDWYHHEANLIEKVEAAMVVAVYSRMRDLGFGPPMRLSAVSSTTGSNASELLVSLSTAPSISYAIPRGSGPPPAHSWRSRHARGANRSTSPASANGRVRIAHAPFAS